VGLASLAFLAACGTFDFGDAPVDEVEVLATAPTFKSDIKPLMELKCMNCHTAAPSGFVPSDTTPLALDVEENFKKLADRVRIRVFESPSDPMPPDFGTPLTTNELAALKKYIADLKAAATPAPTVKPGETVVTLSAAYTSNCAVCHGATGTETASSNGKKIAGTALSEADFILTVREGPITMPNFDTSKISDEDLKADYAKLKKLK
jgi:mono/diheme cytochrome c family protein